MVKLQLEVRVAMRVEMQLEVRIEGAVAVGGREWICTWR